MQQQYPKWLIPESWTLNLSSSFTKLFNTEYPTWGNHLYINCNLEIHSMLRALWDVPFCFCISPIKKLCNCLHLLTSTDSLKSSWGFHSMSLSFILTLLYLLTVVPHFTRWYSVVFLVMPALKKTSLFTKQIYMHRSNNWQLLTVTQKFPLE